MNLSKPMDSSLFIFAHLCSSLRSAQVAMGTGASSYVHKASDAELQSLVEALPDLARLRPQLRPQLLKAFASVAEVKRSEEKKEKKVREKRRPFHRFTISHNELIILYFYHIYIYSLNLYIEDMYNPYVNSAVVSLMLLVLAQVKGSLRSDFVF